VELTVAVCVLGIAFIGQAQYRYYATLDARDALMRNGAARVALLFCETWRAAGGTDAFSPVNHFGSCLAVTACSAAVRESWQPPEGFTLSGAYEVTLDGNTYQAGLSRKQMTGTLRALNVTVRWVPRYPNEPGPNGTGKSYQLTTYAASMEGWN